MQLRVIILKSTSEGRYSALKPSTDPIRPTNSSFAWDKTEGGGLQQQFLAYFHHIFSEQIMF